MSNEIVTKHTPGDLEVRFGDHLVPVGYSARPIGSSTDPRKSAAKYAHVVCITRETYGICGAKKTAAANAARIALTWNCHDDLLAALKYARRNVKASECDIAFIDAAISKASPC